MLLNSIFKKYETIITVEDGTVKGGFGSAILEFAALNKYNNTNYTISVCLPKNYNKDYI